VRVVGFDLGSRRVGVAVTDSDGRLAVPHSTIERSGDSSADIRHMAEAAADLGAARVVVGLPLGLDGRVGAAARAALAEAEALRGALAESGIEVDTFDERLTTVTAERALAESGRRGRARRRVVDRSAAAVMLQAWLDTR
jgi:putative Holliday junction resolvase